MASTSSTNAPRALFRTLSLSKCADHRSPGAFNCNGTRMGPGSIIPRGHCVQPDRRDNPFDRSRISGLLAGGKGRCQRGQQPAIMIAANGDHPCISDDSPCRNKKISSHTSTGHRGIGCQAAAPGFRRPCGARRPAPRTQCSAPLPESSLDGHPRGSSPRKSCRYPPFPRGGRQSSPSR